MNYSQCHRFENLSRKEMLSIQNDLKKKIIEKPYGKTPKIVSGVDISYKPKENIGLGVIVSFNYKTKELIDVTHIEQEVNVPYQTGFLAFRELPIFLSAWEKLKLNPDVVFFDGHGKIHPRRLGIACHASFFINKPTVGIAKTRLIGEFDTPKNNVGNYCPVKVGEETLGLVIRTKVNCKPVFVSVGNQVVLEEALEWTNHFISRYRIPDITRIADYYSKELKQNKVRF